VLLHDVRLALRSLRRNPILSALMIVTIAVGIAASMIAITLYHARAGHPIPWKEDKLYAVTMDTRDDEPDQGFSKHPEYPPPHLTFRDAEAIYRSDIPRYSVMMFRTGRLVSPERKNVKPFDTIVRVTSADFFPAFDVPFQYGGPWQRGSDAAPDNVVVISKYMNDKLFGGENSVGRQITLTGQQFRIVGVLPAWSPQPRFYDLGWGSFAAFDVPEDVFMPFGWMQANKMAPWGVNCVRKTAKITGFDAFFTEDCVWLQYWVQLDSRADLERFQSHVDNYVRDQKQRGRFPRPLNNRIMNVSQWLEFNDVVGDDSRTQVGVAVAFLAVCILNIFGLMLAKFLSAAPIAGLRRALGASRLDIMRQHLIEVVVVGLIGGVAGLAMSFGGLAFLRVLLFAPGLADNDNPARVQMAQSMSHMDVPMIIVATLLSLLAGVLAGLYPAWRIGRLAPATFLKTQ
jgi:putative ABC transport system permease protein